MYAAQSKVFLGGQRSETILTYILHYRKHFVARIPRRHTFRLIKTTILKSNILHRINLILIHLVCKEVIHNLICFQLME